MSKRVWKSKNTETRYKKQHKQIKMKEENISLVMLPQDPDIDCQKLTHKYVHKKFKRIASADIDGNYNQEKQSNNPLNTTSAHSQPHINEPLVEEERHVHNPGRSKAINNRSPLPSNDISHSISIDAPFGGDILKKSTTCQDGAPFASMNGFTSSQQSYGTNISSNEPYKPYKPKFHKACSMSPTEQHSESGERNPIDYSKKSCGSLQQQVQMAPKALEPLNLSKSSHIEVNRKKSPTVEPLYGISSTFNLQSAAYLDEPVPSPGPFLGKTRLVDDSNRRRIANQPNQTVNNLNKFNYIGISAVNDQSGSQKEETAWKKETIQKFPNATIKANDLNIISSTSEFDDHIKVVDSVKLIASPVESMQIAEVSSSVNTMMVATTAQPHSKGPLASERKVTTAGNIASEYIELTSKQIHSTTNDEHVKRPPIVPIGPDVLASARPIPISKDGAKSKSTQPNISFIPNGDGPLRCTLCSATFPKSSLLKMHMNIHYMNPERKFHCDSCNKSFRTQNRLQKHTCFETKVVSKPNNKNPRPFKCSDCNIAFRGHGFLAKHLRSKTHIQNLENLQKIPSGTYVMIEKAQINLTDIDTTDCDSSLTSLKILAKKLKVE